jgi:hypothetical protein
LSVVQFDRSMVHLQARHDVTGAECRLQN